jgi:hypothetical protein
VHCSRNTIRSYRSGTTVCFHVDVYAFSMSDGVRDLTVASTVQFLSAAVGLFGAYSRFGIAIETFSAVVLCITVLSSVSATLRILLYMHRQIKKRKPVRVAVSVLVRPIEKSLFDG